MAYPIVKVISGGQSGVDRAALDVALELGIACGGWCPRGRRAEDGVIPARYPLIETASPSYPERTGRNVESSDATLVIVRSRPRRGSGTALTVGLARRHGKPWLVVDPDGVDAVREILVWLATNRVGSLNVAGPRESESPGIHDAAADLLRVVLATPGQS